MLPFGNICKPNPAEVWEGFVCLMGHRKSWFVLWARARLSSCQGRAAGGMEER